MCVGVIGQSCITDNEHVFSTSYVHFANQRRLACSKMPSDFLHTAIRSIGSSSAYFCTYRITYKFLHYVSTNQVMHSSKKYCGLQAAKRVHMYFKLLLAVMHLDSRLVLIIICREVEDVVLGIQCSINAAQGVQAQIFYLKFDL